MPASETQDFFGVGARRLFRVRHFPEGDTHAVVVFCHAFGEEKKNPHRVFVETARALAERGIASVRFDFAGCGDSSGDLRDATVGLWLEDLAAVLEDCAEMADAGAPRIVLGLRLGASLAATFAAGRADVAALALWHPIAHGKKAFASDLRRTLIKQMMTDGAGTLNRQELIARLERGEGEVDLDGFPFTGRLYRGIAGLDLAIADTLYQGPTLIAQLSHSAAPLAELSPLMDRLAKEGIPTSFEPVVSPPIWARLDRVDSRELIQKTADWIETAIGVSP